MVNVNVKSGNRYDCLGVWSRAGCETISPNSKGVERLSDRNERKI